MLHIRNKDLGANALFAPKSLFFDKTGTIGTLIHLGMGFVSADLDFAQGAEVTVTAMVGARSDTTFNTFVSMFHSDVPPLKDFTTSIATFPP